MKSPLHELFFGIFRTNNTRQPTKYLANGPLHQQPPNPSGRDLISSRTAIPCKIACICHEGARRHHSIPMQLIRWRPRNLRDSTAELKELDVAKSLLKGCNLQGLIALVHKHRHVHPYYPAKLEVSIIPVYHLTYVPPHLQLPRNGIPNSRHHCAGPVCCVRRCSCSYTVSRLRSEPSLRYRNLYDNGKWKTTVVHHQRPSQLQQLESLSTDLHVSRSRKYVIPVPHQP
jgi:hypothetical protein